MKKEELKCQIAQRIRKIQGDLDQRSFAEKLGVTQNKVYRWVNAEGEPSASDLARIATFAGCSTDEIIFGRSQPQSHDSKEITKEVIHLAHQLVNRLNHLDALGANEMGGKEPQLQGNWRHMADSEFTKLLRKAVEESGSVEEMARRCSKYLRAEAVVELLNQERLPTEDEIVVLSAVIKNPATGEPDALWLARIAGIYDETEETSDLNDHIENGCV